MHGLHSRILVSVMVFAALGCSSASLDDQPTDSSPVEATPHAASGLYGIDTRSLESTAQPLSAYSGQVTLVVNVASECGFTPQYTGLQQLHAQLEDEGFSILAFPSNEFGGQEPGDATQIRKFCKENYDVTFPLFEKCITQPGNDQSPVYDFLQDELGTVPSWNFCKFLVGKDGQPIAFFDSRITPESGELRAAIRAALSSS